MGNAIGSSDAGAIRIFDDVISGRTFERPGLTCLLDFARAGDVLCIVRLDRLGRSLRELLETVEMLKRRRDSPLVPGGTNRHHIRRRGTHLPCIRCHRSF